MAEFEIEASVVPKIDDRQKRQVQDELDDLGAGGIGLQSGRTGGTGGLGTDLGDIRTELENVGGTLEQIRNLLAGGGGTAGAVSEFRKGRSRRGGKFGFTTEDLGIAGQFGGRLQDSLNSTNELLRGGFTGVVGTLRTGFDELLEELDDINTSVRAVAAAERFGSILTSISNLVSGTITGPAIASASSALTLPSAGTLASLGAIGGAATGIAGIIEYAQENDFLVKGIVADGVTGFINSLKRGLKGIVNVDSLIEGLGGGEGGDGGGGLTAALTTTLTFKKTEMVQNLLDYAFPSFSESVKTTVDTLTGFEWATFGDSTVSTIESITGFEWATFSDSTKGTIESITSFEWATFSDSTKGTIDSITGFEWATFATETKQKINDITGFEWDTFAEQTRNQIDKITDFSLSSQFFPTKTQNQINRLSSFDLDLPDSDISVLDEFATAVDDGINIEFGSDGLDITVSFDDLSKEISDIVEDEVDRQFEEWAINNGLG